MEYLSDGLTENIINNLSQLPALRVMAWGTVARFKGRETTPAEVGRTLGVRVVLTGRMLSQICCVGWVSSDAGLNSYLKLNYKWRAGISARDARNEATA